MHHRIWWVILECKMGFSRNAQSNYITGTLDVGTKVDTQLQVVSLQHNNITALQAPASFLWVPRRTPTAVSSNNLVDRAGAVREVPCNIISSFPIFTKWSIGRVSHFPVTVILHLCGHADSEQRNEEGCFSNAGGWVIILFATLHHHSQQISPWKEVFVTTMLLWHKAGRHHHRHAVITFADRTWHWTHWHADVHFLLHVIFCAWHLPFPPSMARKPWPWERRILFTSAWIRSKFGCQVPNSQPMDAWHAV